MSLTFEEKGSTLEQLWAPWRIQYILREKQEGCIFCWKPRQGRDAENYILSRGKENFTLMNIYPYNPGHLMVAPYRHIGAIEDLNDAELSEHFRMVRQAVAALKKAMGPQGFNVGLNLGKGAGAGFEEHLHTHVVPRWTGDTSYMAVTAGTTVIAEALGATYEKLKEAYHELKKAV